MGAAHRLCPLSFRFQRLPVPRIWDNIVSGNGHLEKSFGRRCGSSAEWQTNELAAFSLTPSSHIQFPS